MSKSLRLSEKWFRRGLWLVAFVFAWFLVGLGSTIVGDLPQVEQERTLEDFMDPQRTQSLRQAIQAAQGTEREVRDALDQAELRQQAAQASNRAARDTFNNWLATRNATQRPEQDTELIERTQQLDALRQAERDALASVEAQQQRALDARQAQSRAETELQDLEDGARDAFQSELRAQELRVFGYRLLLTLPLLAVAGWLFARKRKSSSWPFVWGFIFFALFAFFVELVPYLPSYGGYVRYLVGIVLTVVGGRYAIQALQRYLERQKLAEAQPAQLRQREMDYDQAQARMTKNVCPGCERPVDMKDGKTDFCPHCGLCLFDRCTACTTRKNAFARYCFSCGASAQNVAAKPAAIEGAPASSSNGPQPAAG